MNVRAHVIVSGRVQGVYFRGSTRREAMKYGVTGWVRNLPDGRVEAVFEGDKDMVDNAVEFAKIGPSHSKVTDIELNWQEYIGDFKDFRILY